MDQTYSDVSELPRLTQLDRIEASDSDVVIPLIREELTVQKELVKKGTVRFTKVVRETPATVNEVLALDRVEVERVPKDEVLSTPPAVRMEGDVMIIPVVEEVLVVTKQFRLKEELRVVNKRTSEEFRQEFTLLSEELIVERTS